MEFTTTIVDLDLGAADFEIQTRCLVLRNGIAATTVARDTTTNPVFKMMIDRWSQTRGPEWLSRHIDEVQRLLALELALAKLAASYSLN